MVMEAVLLKARQEDAEAQAAAEKAAKAKEFKSSHGPLERFR